MWRGVAQLGSALGSGPRGRRFKSCFPDYTNILRLQAFMQPYVLRWSLKTLLIGIKGVAVGAANIMPGVSGATLALIFGIYENLIASINSLFSSPKQSLKFLLPLGFGMAVGIIMFGSIVDVLLTSFPLESRLFIAGLMAGSLPQVHRVALKGHKAKKIYYFVPAVSAILISALIMLSPSPNLALDASLGFGFIAYVFIGGVFAAAALMIPGISGAMVFILFGLYPIVMNVIAQIREYLFSPTNLELLGPIFMVAAPMGLGILVGILICSKLIALLLKKFHVLTYFVIIGLIIGSMVALFSSDTYAISESIRLIQAADIIFALLSFILGCITSIYIGKISKT